MVRNRYLPPSISVTSELFAPPGMLFFLVIKQF